MYFRCAQFTNIQPGCTLVPDQKDPTCCQRPNCPLLPPTGPSPTPGIVTASPQPPGVITGKGKLKKKHILFKKQNVDEMKDSVDLNFSADFG